MAVGAWSLLDPDAFPDETVWSGFGSGYACVPLLLPVLALAWLTARARSGAAPSRRESKVPSPRT